MRQLLSARAATAARGYKTTSSSSSLSSSTSFKMVQGIKVQQTKQQHRFTVLSLSSCQLYANKNTTGRITAARTTSNRFTSGECNYSTLSSSSSSSSFATTPTAHLFSSNTLRYKITTPSSSSSILSTFSTEATTESPSSSSIELLQDLNTQTKKKKKRRKRKPKNNQQQQQQQQLNQNIPTKGINNRPILTSLPSNNNTNLLSLTLSPQNAKMISNQLSLLFNFTQTIDTKTFGPSHKPTFITTLSTTFDDYDDDDEHFPKLCTVPNDAFTKEEGKIITLINTGSASNKKDALTYAYIDFLIQCETECGIPLSNPNSIFPQEEEHQKEEEVNEIGRPIFTFAKLDSFQKKNHSSSTNDKNVVKINTRNVRNIMHNLQQKMMFEQRSTHDSIDNTKQQRIKSHGGGANFIATLKTVFEHGVLGSIPHNAIVKTKNENDPYNNNNNNNNNMEKGYVVQLVNSGAARTKKDALSLASIDLLHQLQNECNINLNDPPNTKAKHQQQEKERFKRGVRDAQMILELLGARRPKFTTEKIMTHDRGGGSFVTTMSAILEGGKKLDITGPPADSKAKAQGLAIISAVVGGPLEELFGKDHLDACVKVIQEAPAEHVSRLTVPPLPEEAWFVLEEALGTREDHEERMRMVKEMQEQIEERRRNRDLESSATSWQQQQQLQQSVEQGEYQAQISESRQNQRNTPLQKRMEREEQNRTENAKRNPQNSQAQINAIRAALPITKIQNQFLEALQTNQVVVVSGGTGSGKSTQCPQYILEDAIQNQKKGPETKIIVTQPRRIAASSVAERVATERGERLGNSVGYTVRLKSIPPRDVGGSIEFVTTGVLLRRFMRDKTLRNISHVVIDEVHERDINTDFLLVLLRDLMKERPDLRVVLMSATLDAESFCDYFAAVDVDGSGGGGDGDEKEEEKRTTPLVGVPTEPRHPIEIVHLEDIAGEGELFNNDGGGEESNAGLVIPQGLEYLAKELLQAHDEQLQLDLEEAEAEEQAALELEQLSKAEDIGRILTGESDLESSDSDSDDNDDDDDDENGNNLDSQENVSEKVVLSPRRARAASRVRALRRAMAMRPNSRLSSQEEKPSPPVNKKAREREVSDIAVALMAKTAQSVAQKEINAGRKGSVLCFLPGWDEIKETMAILETCNAELYEKLDILPLHSTIPREDQQRVFLPASDGRIKLILATNIAESSVTINDVLAVIDSGLVREMNWDPECAMSTMCTVPTSKASVTQRTGRAGRVAPGTCYRLFSRGALEAMPARPIPEIQRTALEATCLQTCNMTEGRVDDFLSRAMDPPPEESVTFALDRLEELGAIQTDETGETLSPLGHLLSRLPLDPATGKMLITGCVMKCLDPVLTAAACFSSRNLFYTPLGMRDEARQVRRSFSENSDLMATVRAYDTFNNMLQEKGWNETRTWASDNFISVAAVNNISSVRSQLLSELLRIGLVHERDLEPRFRRKKVLRYDASVNENASNDSLFSAVWATALPGNLCARRQLGNFGTLRTRMEDHTGLHPSSVAFYRKPPKAEENIRLPGWFFYHEMVLTSQVFLRNCTPMKPEQIMLFGGNSLKPLSLPGDNANKFILDDWVVVGSRCEDTLQFLSTIRREIDAAIALKVMNPRKPLTESSDDIIDAVSHSFNILDERDEPQYTD